ncbi:MAG: hypothetical protein ACMG6E_04600 [Candidatus Roizmanbacteria bacterium]
MTNYKVIAYLIIMVDGFGLVLVSNLVVFLYILVLGVRLVLPQCVRNVLVVY